MVKMFLSGLIIFLFFEPALSQDIITEIPSPPPDTAIDASSSTTTTTITTPTPITTVPPGTTVSPGATVTQPSPPVTPSVIVAPSPATVTTPSITTVTTPSTTPVSPDTSTSLTTTSTNITTPVNLGPNMMFSCSGVDPNWHMDMTQSGMHFHAPTITTSFVPTPPISTVGAMQGSILVYTTTTHNHSPVTVTITKNDMGCRAAPGGSSKIDGFIVLPNKVFVGCCMPK